MPTNKPESQPDFPHYTTLRCGPITAHIHDGFLRDIEHNGQEILRGIYFSVRDDHWREVRPVVAKREILQSDSTFTINLLQHYNAEAVALECQISIHGDEHGTLAYSFSARPTGECRTNRLGLCVLHGSQVSGEQLSITTTDGDTVSGSFPNHISAHQPYTDISSLRWYPVDETEATLFFHGDSFEMEDQRNWSDDSFKTYCTPLKLPKPVLRHEGDCVSQQVLLKVQLPSRSSIAMGGNLSDRNAIITIKNHAKCSLPLIGLTCPMQQEGDLLTDQELDLNITHVWLQIDVRTSGWRSMLLKQIDRIEQRGMKLALEVDGVEDEQALREFLETVQGRSSVLPVMLFANSSCITDEEILNIARTTLSRYSWSVRLAGGTRGHYAQLNRSNVNCQDIDSVFFAITPTVHMSDLISITETLNAQRQMVSDVSRYLSRNVSVNVGPITMIPRFNADFPISNTNPIADRPDVLYHTPFYTAWLIGSIAALSQSGVRSLTYSYHGILGNGVDTKLSTPAARVLAEVNPRKSQYVLEVETSDAAAHCLALQNPNTGEVRLFVANVSGASRTFEIYVPDAAKGTTAVMVTECGDQGTEVIPSDSRISLRIPKCGTAIISTRFR